MPPIPGTGKRAALSLEVKLKILDAVDAKVLSKSDIAKVFKIPKSTMFTIIKNRASINQLCKSGFAPDRSRARDAKYPKLEQALVEWVKYVRSQNIPIDGNILKAKAETFALRMNHEDFKASDGWIQKFKSRHGLVFKKLCGESAAVDMNAVTMWKEDKFKKLIAEYDLNDVFNADETGLFFKMLPDRTFLFKGEKCNGGKKAKQRITALLAANMTGTEKLPILIIGKAQKPRCFKGVRSLPVTYKANSKAWMTGIIFEEWIRNLDRKMAASGRKILLIIDNCTAHPEVSGLTAVKVEFLPPNVTSVLQPLDQGIIQSFKKFYRRMLLNRIILCVDNEKSYEIDILGAIHLANAAWKDVTEETIKNCFRHAGWFPQQPEAALPLAREAAENVVSPVTCFDAPDDVLFEKLRDAFDLPKDLNFSDYVEIDSQISCAEELSEDGIISRITRTENTATENSSDEESELQQPRRATFKETTDALEVVRGFLERQENSQDFLSMLMDIENHVLRSGQQFKQAAIESYFQKK